MQSQISTTTTTYTKVIVTASLMLAVSVAALFFIITSNVADALSMGGTDREVMKKELEKRETIVRELDLGENYILQAELKMLDYKYKKNASGSLGSGGLDFARSAGFGGSWGMKSPSGLHTDLYGGFKSWNSFNQDESLNLITGARAIDESLQLGSVGREWNDPDRVLLSSVQSSLDSYKYEFKKYPNSLKDFAKVKRPQTNTNSYYYDYYWKVVWYNGQSRNIADLADKFEYHVLPNGSYSLKLKETQKEFTLSDIAPLKIKSHPWQEMIKGKNIERSKIFSFVPDDDFLVYFNDVSVAVKLEDAAKAISGPFYSIGRSEEMVGIMEKVTKRLGITNIKELEPYLGEVAFVSEDLDFYPKTEYALIIKLHSDFLKNLFSSFTSEKNFQALHDDYLILSTSKGLLDEIEARFRKEKPSMYESLDFAYTLSVLDSRRDGFAYFSEKFITKLVGPEYRILARRRNSVIQALETLQYIVFAYRDLKGVWPKSLEQIADEGYINSATIHNIEDYSIDPSGWVVHKDWEGLNDIASVSDVDLGNISRIEKSVYENFRDGYERYWREFFDPIGVAVVVSDQIMFHTVILPLIQESQYNYMVELFGGDPIEFSFVKNPIRAPALQAVGKLNDMMLYYRMMASEGYSEGTSVYYSQLQKEADQLLKKYKVEGLSKYNQPYKEGVYDYFQRYPLIQCLIAENYVDVLALEGGNTECDDLKKKILKEYPKFDYDNFSQEFKIEEKKLVKEIVNENIKKWLDWKTDKDVLSMIGNEVMLGMGEDMKFSIENIADLDIYFGLKLKDAKLAQEFLLKVFEKISKEIVGQESYSAGFFSISTTKPMKNTYRDIEYYVVPTGFVNAYYTFLGDSFYLTISQLAINKLVDGYIDNRGKKPQEIYSPEVVRGMANIGDKQNIALHADFEKMNTWTKNIFESSNFQYSEIIGSRIRQDYAYLAEANTLARSLPNYDRTWKNVDGVYYKHLPKNYPGGDWKLNDDGVYLDVGGKEYTSETLRNMTDDKVKELYKGHDLKKLLLEGGVIKNASIGLKLTREGLDSRLSFTNPLETPKVQKIIIPPPQPLPKPSPERPNFFQKLIQDLSWPIAAMIGAVILLIIMLVIIEIIIHRKKNIPPNISEPPGDQS